MKKITFLATIIFTFAFVGITKAQFDYIKPDDMDQFHNRTLIVIIEKPSDLVTEKLNKKHKTGAVDAYAKAMNDFNKNFADAVVKYWKVNTGEVEYKTMDEINDITDKRNYAVLFCRSVSQADLGTPYITKNGVMWWPDFKEVGHDKDFSDKMTVVGLSLLDKFGKAPIYQFPLPDLYPTRQDLEYAMNVANQYIDYRSDHRKDSPAKLDEGLLKENQPTLKDKTLLLRRDWLDKRLTPAEIQKYYPYPFLIAGKDTIDKAIDSADSKYAVAMVVPCDLAAGANGGIQYAEYAYNLEDGNILASSGVPDMPSNPKGGTASTVSAGKPLITKKTLLDFIMYNDDSSDDSSSGGKKKGKK